MRYKIAEAEYYWPSSRRGDEIEFNFVLKLIGATLLRKDRLSSDDTYQLVGFSTQAHKLSNDSAERKLCKRIKQFTSDLYQLEQFIPAQTCRLLVEMVKKDKSLDYLDARELYYSICNAVDVSPVKNGSGRVGWLAMLKQLQARVIQLRRTDEESL